GGEQGCRRRASHRRWAAGHVPRRGSDAAAQRRAPLRNRLRIERRQHLLRPSVARRDGARPFGQPGDHRRRRDGDADRLRAGAGLPRAPRRPGRPPPAHRRPSPPLRRGAGRGRFSAGRRDAAGRHGRGRRPGGRRSGARRLRGEPRRAPGTRRGRRHRPERGRGRRPVGPPLRWRAGRPRRLAPRVPLLGRAHARHGRAALPPPPARHARPGAPVLYGTAAFHGRAVPGGAGAPGARGPRAAGLRRHQHPMGPPRLAAGRPAVLAVAHRGRAVRAGRLGRRARREPGGAARRPRPPASDDRARAGADAHLVAADRPHGHVAVGLGDRHRGARLRHPSGPRHQPERDLRAAAGGAEQARRRLHGLLLGRMRRWRHRVHGHLRRLRLARRVRPGGGGQRRGPAALGRHAGWPRRSAI
ncbi:MAG: Uncharacterized MFS-type transporter, partial [uncultured Acetobacteraceae bacterium]